MIPNPILHPIRRAIAEQRTAVNGWLAIPGVLAVEAMARAGWDSLTVDLQHGTADYADMLAMLPVIQAAGAAPVVRVPWNDPALVMRALDAGALAVICPMIETAADARDFVSACLYPPRGRRSFGPVRARLAYGDGYGAAANDLVMPIAMIETRAALDNLEAILAVDGLGAVYIGPADLSQALGLPPGFDRREPEIMAAILRVRDAARARGVPACVHCMTPGYAAEMAALGFALVTIGGDARFVEAGARAAVEGFRTARAGG